MKLQNKTKNSCPTGRNQGTQKNFKNANKRSDGERSSKNRASMQDKQSSKKRR